MTVREPGSRVGPYRIVEPLGRGGMGVVYRARDDDRGREVALKTVKAQEEGLIASLRREIHALAKLDHPGIVRIVDEGVEVDGTPWYAMDLVPGTTLSAYVRGGWAGPTTQAIVGDRWWTGASSLAPAAAPPRSVDSLRRILSAIRRVCAPLAYLHGEGIVHRDLKPDNVVVRHDGHPVIVDFGLATSFASGLAREQLDFDDPSQGTLAFMPPEILSGALVDARADLYALGCILYVSLTGRLPFGAIADLMDVAIQPAPPSALAGPLPDGLDALVLSLLERRPEDRIGHAVDVARALAAMEGPGQSGDPESPAPAPRPYLYRPALAGRSELVTRLSEHVDAALSRGAGGAILVSGESGIGKTRLLLELATAVARRGAMVVTGQCDPRAPAPFAPLRGVLLTIAGRARALPADRREALFPDVEALAPFALDGIAEPRRKAASWDEARFRVFQALLAALAAIGAEAPLLCVIDDLQWADDLTVGFLRHAAPRIGALPVFVAASYRSEERTAAVESLAALGEVRPLPLERLEDAAMASLVAGMLAVREPPAGLLRRVTASAEGNPFFAAEYLRSAIEQRLLGRDDLGRWSIADAEPALGLPRTLRDLVGGRLARLGEPARDLASLLAVIGREADARTVALAAGRSGEAPFADLGAVTELLARSIVEEPSPGVLRFTHDKIREVAYDAIETDARRSLHERVAEALAPGAAGSGGWAALAHHWKSAGRDDAARPCHLAAARWARDHHDPVEAVRHYESHLELSRAPSPERAGARLELGRILAMRGGDAAASFSAARDDARALGDRLSEAEALLRLAVARDRSGAESEGSLAMLQEALAIAASGAGARSLALQGEIEGAIAIIFMDLGRRAEARPLFASAVARLHEAGERDSEAEQIANLARLDMDEGKLREALEGFERTLAIHEETGNELAAGRTKGFIANLLHFESSRRSRAMAADAIATLRKWGDRASEAAALGIYALVSMSEGEIDDARDAYRAAAAFFREAGPARRLVFMLVQASFLERIAGRLDEAQAIMDECLAIPLSTQDIIHGFRLSSLGGLLLAQGRDARATLEELRALAAQMGSGPGSALGHGISEIEEDMASIEAGEVLFRGRRYDRYPGPVRAWFERTGQAPEPAFRYLASDPAESA
ncbi:MAG: protein kinase [Acidobacteriota bacterium]